MRTRLVWLILIAFLLQQASAQEESASVQLRLRDERSAEGSGMDLIFLIGEALSRHAETGEIRMTGGVQVRQGDNFLLVSEEIVATPAIPSQIDRLESTDQLIELILTGRVFASASGVQAEAEHMVFDLAAERLTLTHGPSRVVVGGQSLRLEGGAQIDLQRGIFQSNGEVTFVEGDITFSATRLQVRREPNQSSKPEILAEGRIRAIGSDFSFTAGRIESSADGLRLHFSGGVTYIGTAGRFSAGRMTFDLDTQDFTIDRQTSTPIRGLGFIDL